MPNHDRDLTEHARRLAAKAHTNSRPYGNLPYITHPAAVAKLLTPYGAEAVAAGWLHDTVEDTDVTLDQLRADGFPENVVTAVDAVSRRTTDGVKEPYFDFVRRAAQHDLGRIVKLADNIHNSSGLDQATDRLWAAGMKKRYRHARQILEHALVVATARLDGFARIGGISVCDLDDSDGPFTWCAIGHHPAGQLLHAFQERATQLEHDNPPTTTADIVQGHAIWTGTVKNWQFITVPDDTTPGAFPASWILAS